MTDGSWTDTFVKVSGAWPLPPLLLDDELELELELELEPESEPDPPHATIARETNTARGRNALMTASVP